MNIPLTIAFGDYDRVRPLVDGRVKIEGVDATFLSLSPEEMFFRAIRFQEFDVSEISLSGFSMLVSRGDCPYVGVPVFLSRMFRHSAIYVRTDRGIERPEDLAGRIVGVPEYTMTAAVWVRGLLEEQYGVPARAISWRTGGLEEPRAMGRIDFAAPAGTEILASVNGKPLAAALEDGELDAVIAARAPSPFQRGSRNIRRLFPDFEAAERTYYASTGIFPIMHAVGVRRSLVERHPWLPASLFKAFARARDLAWRDLTEITTLSVMLPWLSQDVRRAREFLGDDYWTYGVERNRDCLAAFLRFMAAQGLVAKAPTLEELFAPSTHHLAKI